MTMKQNDNEERQKTVETVSLDSAQRVLAVPTPAETISFSEWRAVINDNFPDLLFAAEIGLSIIAQISEEQKAIYTLHQHGYSIRSIGRMFSLAPESVRYRLKELNRNKYVAPTKSSTKLAKLNERQSK